MNATAIGVPSRNQDLPARLAEARRLTDKLFAIVRPEAMYERPIPQRHRLICNPVSPFAAADCSSTTSDTINR